MLQFTCINNKVTLSRDEAIELVVLEKRHEVKCYMKNGGATYLSNGTPEPLELVERRA